MMKYIFCIFQTVEKDSHQVESVPTKRIVVDNSVIKGCHAFKIRPPCITPMPQLPIDREYTNVKDEIACLVWLPQLQTFPLEITP
jgi:hypothetical protein